MLNFIRTVTKYEVYFFYTLTVLNLLPILLFETFPTVDGPAHLYNSRLIHELLTGDSDYLSIFFAFNDFFIPNWLGHFILSNLMWFFPALIAEKILLSIYLLLLPLSFRFLIKELSTENHKGTFALYLVFPFTYSYLFYFGFYNFHLGMVLLFITIGLWINQSRSNHIDTKKFAFLMLLSVLIYYSHIFVFAMLVGAIGFITLINIVNQPYSRAKFLTYLKFPLLLIAPGCILTLIYLANHEIIPDNFSNSSSLSHSWSMIQSIEPARAIQYGQEGVFTKWIFFILVVMVCNLIIIRLKNIKARINQNSIIMGGISFGLLISFFVIPNGLTFISPRLLVFFFLFFILFLSTQKINVWVKIISFIIINYVNVALLMIYIESTSEINKITKEIVAAAKHIEPYSTVLPINDSDYWVLGNSSNYLGVDKPLVILDNYEAYTNYFPLVWNINKLPYLYLGDTKQISLKYPINKKNTKSQIDYIFIIKDINNPKVIGKKEMELKDILDEYYNLVYTNDRINFKIFKKVLNKTNLH